MKWIEDVNIALLHPKQETLVLSGRVIHTVGVVVQRGARLSGQKPKTQHNNNNNAWNIFLVIILCFESPVKLANG